MGVIFDDTFTEASNTTLASHTPDTGAGWTLQQQVGTTVLAQVEATGDHCETDGNDTDALLLYTADDAITGVDMNVDVTLKQEYTGNNTDFLAIIGQWQDDSNYYGVYFEGDGSGIRLFKYVAASRTIGTFVNHDFASGNRYRLEIRNGSQKLILDPDGTPSTIRTETWTDFDGISGRGGLGWGNVAGFSVHGAHSTWQLDDFKVEDVNPASSDPEAGLIGGKLVGGGVLVKGALVG